jgi:GxxExxY protein
MVVGGCVIVEIKAAEKTSPIHDSQLLTYLKLSGYRLGLLIKDGIRRLIRAV